MRAAVAVLALLPFFAAPAAAQWVAGVHYEVLDLAGGPELRADGRIEVIEVFWYGCPSCYNFEPHLIRWLANKPDDVEFVRIAASLSPSWRVHARAFYTAEALGKVEALHPRIFRTIHIDRNPLNTLEAMSALFIAHAGADEETFRRTYLSFAVETKMRRGDRLVRRYRLGAVPSIVINGRYRTNPGMTRGYPELIQVMGYLIEKERQ